MLAAIWLASKSDDVSHGEEIADAVNLVVLRMPIGAMRGYSISSKDVGVNWHETNH